MSQRILVIDSNLIIGTHIKNMLLEKGYDVHDEVFTDRDKVDIYMHRASDFFIVNNAAVNTVTEIVQNGLSHITSKIISLKCFDLFKRDEEDRQTIPPIKYIDKPFTHAEILNCIQ